MKIPKVHLWLSLLLTLAIIAGCSQSAKSASTSAPVTPISSTFPTETIPPILDLTPTSHPTMTPQLQEQCLNISTDGSIFQGQNMGSLVIGPDITTPVLQQKLDDSYLYEVSSGKKISLPNASRFAVSLDNEQLAYVTHDEQLMIIDSNQKVIAQSLFEDVSIFGWAKDGLFVHVDGKGQQAFLNPFTGDHQLLVGAYPNLYPVERGWQPYWYPLVIYSPDLTRVVYAAMDERKIETYIVLRDLQSGRELITVSHGTPLSIAPETKPEWSFDSQQVILQTFSTNSEENTDRALISIHRDGFVQILLPLDNKLATMHFSLSPDQKQVAFWSPDASSSQISNLSLYVLNIETGETVNYCVVSPKLSGKPIWSPDSQSLVVESLMHDLENSDVIIVDLTRKIAVKVADDSQPVGWLK